MGGSRPQILQYGSKKWGIVDRAIDDLIARATVLMTAELSKEATVTLETHIRRQTQLRFRCYASGRYDLCHQIDQDLAKMQALYPSEKTDLTIHRPKPVAWRPIQDAFRHPAKAPEPAIPAIKAAPTTNGSHHNGNGANPNGAKPK